MLRTLLLSLCVLPAVGLQSTVAMLGIMLHT
jgi:hypothetical protein